MSDGRGWESGYLLSRALSSLSTVGTSRTDGWSNIRKFWEALAAGDVEDEDAAQWAREIAKRVVRDVLDEKVPPLDRPRSALASLGLVGVEGKHPKEREYVQMFEEFRKLAEEDGRSFSLSRKHFAEQMLKGGYFDGLSLKGAMTAIDHLKKTNLPKK